MKEDWYEEIKKIIENPDMVIDYFAMHYTDERGEHNEVAIINESLELQV
ncbi:hypothetical protein [Terrilactibacillus laevilacticus]|uniref:Uncharacterized protein n=1 Tax=Terrilactibacillus laevilacticus TaxID=1380157 RepID=A0ABW5PNU5_9BACI|nr:hypothetical protein [Terrilactibacillus laevilacticus]